MFREHDQIILTADIPAKGLKSGDVGTIALAHETGDGYEVEFVNLDGDAIAIISLTSKEMRPTSKKDIPHVRELAA
jgi:hypothetical protein